jgi:hypothetical protein
LFSSGINTKRKDVCEKIHPSIHGRPMDFCLDLIGEREGEKIGLLSWIFDSSYYCVRGKESTRWFSDTTEKGQRDKETKRQRDKETERQRDRETERQRDRETGRQGDRKIETERQRGGGWEGRDGLACLLKQRGMGGWISTGMRVYAGVYKAASLSLSCTFLVVMVVVAYAPSPSSC